MNSRKIINLNLSKSPKNSSLDDILKEAAEGYGDLVAAAVIHGVSLKALQYRLIDLQN